MEFKHAASEHVLVHSCCPTIYLVILFVGEATVPRGVLLRVIAGPLCGAVLSLRGQQLEDKRNLAQSRGWLWCDMLSQRWKMNATF